MAHHTFMSLRRLGVMLTHELQNMPMKHKAALFYTSIGPKLKHYQRKNDNDWVLYIKPYLDMVQKRGYYKTRVPFVTDNSPQIVDINILSWYPESKTEMHTHPEYAMVASMVLNNTGELLETVYKAPTKHGRYITRDEQRNKLTGTNDNVTILMGNELHIMKCTSPNVTYSIQVGLYLNYDTNGYPTGGGGNTYGANRDYNINTIDELEEDDAAYKLAQVN